MMRKALTFSLLCWLLPLGTAAAEVIHLKPSATVGVRQDVRLGDVATVSGDDAARAQQLADTIILVGVEKSITLKSDDIVMAIISQDHNAASHVSLQISGARTCDLSVGTPAPKTNDKPKPAAARTTPVALVQNASKAEKKPAESTPVAQGTADAPGSLAEIIRARVREESGVPAEDLAIRFETISPLVEESPLPGRKWLCRPLTRTFLGTVPFEAQLVEGTKVVERINVQATVQQMQWVPVSLARISRGEVVTAEMVHMERLPLDRKLKNLFTRSSEVVGLEAQRDIEVGAMLDDRDFRPAYMAHKNESITVVYTSGALSVQMRGRALADAKIHERVRVRNEATHEEYTATVIGKDLAVAGSTLTADQEKQLREGM